MTWADFDRSPNPLYLDVPLRHVADLPVLGIPVRFESNSAAALEAIEDAFGAWRALHDTPELIAAARVRVRVIVHDGDEGGAPHAPVTCRMPSPDRVIVHTPGSVGIADCARGEATAYVTPALLADRAHARYGMLEGMTLPIVTACDRYPVHAAAVARGRVALLLAGPAGIGKSTLAYQAHRRGLRVLSDDSAYVQLEPAFRLWGTPGRVYLAPEARAHFPELAGRPPALLVNGNEKLVVEVSGEWPAPGAAAPVASRAGVCLLERTAGAVSLAAAAPTEVQSFLRGGMGLSAMRFDVSLDRALAQLTRLGGWRLSLSDNPAEALPLIDAMLTQLDGKA